MKNFFIRFWFKVIGFIANYTTFLLYPILWKLKLLLKYIIRYRRKTITKNLTKSFGRSVSQQEIKNLRSKTYDVLIRHVKEILFTFSWPESKLLSKIKFEEAEMWQEYFDKQKSTIVTASHYGNWEMNIVLFPKFVKQRVIAFYKPMSDKNMETFLNNKRSKYGLELYPIEQTVRIMAEFAHENILYIFISDQSPLNMNGVYWNNFLNQETPWLTGAERLAKKFNYPVVYLSQTPQDYRKSNPYFYKISISLLSESNNIGAMDSITEAYSKKLESEIIKKPEYWLWSHKRWKRANLFPEIE